MNYTKIAKIFAKTLYCHCEEWAVHIIVRLLRFARNDGGKELLGRARDFVKYHNAFSVVLVVAIVLTGSAMASEPVRDILADVAGEKVVVEKGIDNALLLEVDLDAFDLAMTIDAVSEDSDNYYIEYSYDTIGIMDNTWQTMARKEIMTVSKSELKGEDLGLYLTEELGEIADCELVFLREMQEKELTKGVTEIVETIDYSGLIGLVLDVKNKILPDYEPVVKPEIVVQQQTAAVVPVVPTSDQSSIIDDNLSAPEPSADNDNLSVINDQLPPTCESFTYSDYTECAEDGTQIRTVLTSLPENCVDGNPVLSQTCECEVSDTPQPDTPDELPAEPVCDSDHITLCDTREKCEIVGLYWHGDICNLQPEIPGGDSSAEESILGCTDETALNYNPEATEDDSSCEYPPADNDQLSVINDQLPDPEPPADNDQLSVINDQSPPTCESFTYSDYTECAEDGTQTRTVLTSSPEACVDGEPILSQLCEYTSPEPEPEPAE